MPWYSLMQPGPSLAGADAKTIVFGHQEIEDSELSIVEEILAKPMDPRSPRRMHEIAVNFRLLDLFMWWPVVHPKDAHPAKWENSDLNREYYKATQGNVNWGRWQIARQDWGTEFKKHWGNDRPGRQVAAYSVGQWFATKGLEVAWEQDLWTSDRVAGLGRGQNAYKASLFFNKATGKNVKLEVRGKSPFLANFLDAAWYYVQPYWHMNAWTGGSSFPVSDIDLQYTLRDLRRLAIYTEKETGEKWPNGPSNLIQMLDLWRAAVAGDGEKLGRPGWHNRKVDFRSILYDRVDWGVVDPKPVLQKAMDVWLEESQKYSIAEWREHKADWWDKAYDRKWGSRESSEHIGIRWDCILEMGERKWGLDVSKHRAFLKQVFPKIKWDVHGES